LLVTNPSLQMLISPSMSGLPTQQEVSISHTYTQACHKAPPIGIQLHFKHIEGPFHEDSYQIECKHSLNKNDLKMLTSCLPKGIQKWNSSFLTSLQ
jgi:hypothetical protein